MGDHNLKELQKFHLDIACNAIEVVRLKLSVDLSFDIRDFFVNECHNVFPFHFICGVNIYAIEQENKQWEDSLKMQIVEVLKPRQVLHCELEDVWSSTSILVIGSGMC
jgi:hypothetical protein